jgi:chitin disaccharide deacetylase
MQPNPVLKKSGLSSTDRLLILHADDIGMCQATLPAFNDLISFGLVTSGAVMVPCPWFPSVANLCRSNPDLDMGVHITLNCEWDAYRWKPLSTVSLTSGLIDAEGYFHRTVEETQRHATSEAAQAEMGEQVTWALAAGIKPTHIDTHMGTVLHPKFLPAYVQIALQYKLPLLALRLEEEGWRAMGADADTAHTAAEMMRQLEYMGMPLHDGLFSMELSQPDNRVEQARQVIRQIPPGLSRLYIHPSCDTPESRAISPDWRARVADYETFMLEEMKTFIKDEGIHLIRYRALQELIV